MKKTKFIFLVLILIIVGCSPAEEKLQTSGEVMKVSVDYWPGNFWINIAEHKGWFEEAGLNVELINIHGKFIESQQDFINKKTDVHQLVLYDFVKFYEQGNQIKAVVDADITLGADGIVAKEDIKDVADLEGKTIGVIPNSFLEFMLDVALKKSDLSLEDVNLVEFYGEEIDVFVNGDIDAIVTWEPFMSQAVKKSGGNKIFDTSEVQGVLSNVISFHQSFIDERPNDVQVYVNTWYRTTEFIKENPNEAFDIVADIYDVPVDDVSAFAKQVKILDLRDNEIAFSYATSFESLHGTSREINNFMIKQGITEKRLDGVDFLDSRFIKEIE